MLRPTLLLLCALPVAAQDDLGQRIDALFQPWDSDVSPGASVSVLHRGEVVFSDGYGLASLEQRAPITPETIFHVASVSKQFTAFALCLLAVDGKLSLDDPVRAHLPRVPDFGTPITLRHLLHHTSGLRDQWEALAIAGWRLDDVITTEHVLTLVEHQRELNFPPGSEHLYCNTGYTLAGQVVARVSGQTLPEFCAARIFEPLGMTRTHFHDDHERVVVGRADSYRDAGEGFERAVLSYANAGATSLFTTSRDLLRWLQNWDAARVGGPQALELMRQRYVLTDGSQGRYALGVSLTEHRGRENVAHSGGDAGFRAFVVWFPAQELGIAVLANLGSVPVTSLAYHVADLVLGDDPLAPEVPHVPAPRPDPPEVVEREEVTLSPERLASYAGHYRLQSNEIELEVRVENGQVWLDGPGETAHARPYAVDRFYFAEGTATVSFARGWNGAPTVLRIHQGGQVHRFARFHPATPSELGDYVGRYWSEELGTFYDLEVTDGQLVAVHRRHGRIPLGSRGEDAFQGSRWFFGRVVFTRDEAGTLDAFRLSGSRVRNLRFVRQ